MSSVQAELILFLFAGQALYGRMGERAFTRAFEQMRLDNTASSVTLHPLCLEVTFHYYQVTSPHRFSAKTKLCFPPSKSARKCIALPRTLIDICPA